MPNLSTQFLGITLKNPLVPSASPLTRDTVNARKLEDAGASALIMYSLFEEKITSEQQHLMRFLFQQGIGHAEAETFHPIPEHYKTSHETYLEQIQKLKKCLSIPLIASLNGNSLGGWIDYARDLQQAGADALELNIYQIPSDAEQTGQQLEEHYLSIVEEVRNNVTIPLTIKLSPQFSSPLNLIQKIEHAGANGVGLFNRFYQADIDLDTLSILPKLELSNSSESLLRIRWAALLHGRTNLSIGVTGGFHSMEDVLKALLAGADVVHLCSALLKYGPNRLTQILTELAEWLDQQEYESISQLRGSISYQHASNPGAYERANYLEILDNYTPTQGVWW